MHFCNEELNSMAFMQLIFNDEREYNVTSLDTIDTIDTIGQAIWPVRQKGVDDLNVR